jgi:hypothetical protein
VKNGGQRDWSPDALPGLLSVVASATAGKEEVKLWGNCSAGWPYHGLACGLGNRVLFYDPKIPGYVVVPELGPDGEGSQLLNWKVEERDGYSFVEYVIPGQIFDVRNLPAVIPPAAPAGKGVVLSGKGPWWLTGAILRSYTRAGARWVAAFTPQVSSRCEADGRKWAEAHPGCGPAVVVSSHDAEVPLGAVVAFELR